MPLKELYSPLPQSIRRKSHLLHITISTKYLHQRRDRNKYNIFKLKYTHKHALEKTQNFHQKFWIFLKYYLFWIWINISKFQKYCKQSVIDVLIMSDLEYKDHVNEGRQTPELHRRYPLAKNFFNFSNFRILENQQQ